MSLIKHLKRPAVGAKAGGMYADGLVPGQSQGFARGRVPNALINGIVRGEGGPTEDKVPAKVSPDEAILPAKTVQALGGPAAIKALIERTNDGQPPESEVAHGGRYANGFAGAFDMSYDDVRNGRAPAVSVPQPAPTPNVDSVPQRIPQVDRQPSPPPLARQEPGNIYTKSNDDLARVFQRQDMPRVDMLGGAEMQRPGLSQPLVKHAQFQAQAATPGRANNGSGDLASVADYVNRGDPVKDIVRGLGEKMLGVGKFFADSAEKARQPNMWDDSGTRLQYPDSPAVKTAPRTAGALAAAAVPSNPNYSNEPNAPVPTSAPAPVKAAQSAPAAPASVPLIAAAPYRNTPDAPPEMRGADYANQQLANIRGGDEPGPKVGVIADPAAQERRAFDNFVTRSNGEAAYRDAIRSGKPQNIQAAGGSLAGLTQVGDQQENKAGEFQRGMEALATKSLFDREAENNRGRIGLAQAALQGKNALASETMRGNNALVTEAMRGTNALAVADRNAAAQQAAREYMNPLDAQLKQAQLSDANVKASLRDKILNASPEEQAALARQVAAMDGRYADKDSAEVAKARMGLIGEIAKAYNGPMGVPLGADKNPIPFDQYADPILRAAGASGGQPAQQQTPGTVSTGQVINGYRFKGGDPSKQSSWEKA